MTDKKIVFHRAKSFRIGVAISLMIVVIILTFTSSAWAMEHYRVLHKFRNKGGDGLNSNAGLIFDGAGNLYGTTSNGGANGNGTVFKLLPNPDGSWTESVLHSFAGSDGGWPYAGLIFDATGNLYGTTEGGGADRYGTVFKLVPNPDGNWTESVLHSFAYSDGSIPKAGLIFDATGNLYGTTSSGGAHGDGTVFKLAPNPDGSWTESVLHSFGPGDGDTPIAGLIFDGAGNLYGTTSSGGAHGDGTVFKLAPNPDGSWTESVLHRFANLDGAYPYGGLIFDGAGNLYGTTFLWGGAHTTGNVFKLTHNPDGSWKRSTLHAFNDKTGANPCAELIFDAAGNLYGTTSAGGAYDTGVVFKLTPNPDGTWKWSGLHNFNFPLGAWPQSGLIFDGAGNLYGTTWGGGKGNIGVVFRITP